MATVNLSDYKPLNINDADEFSIGIVISEWNGFVTDNLHKGCIEVLLKEGVKKENIHSFPVPGAYELSFASMQLCKQKKICRCYCHRLRYSWGNLSFRLCMFSSSTRD